MPSSPFVLITFAAAAALLNVQPTCGFQWKDQYVGQVQVLWDNNCDFVAGNVRDIQVVDSSGSGCAVKCVRDSQCTHFTWNGACIMKKAPATEAAQPYNTPGARCGFVPIKSG